MMNLFKELLLNQQEKQRFFIIAGKLVESGRRVVLRLSGDYAYKKAYLTMEARLDKLSFAT